MARAVKPIVNLSRENIACEHTEIADAAWRRMRGLLGRSSLQAGEGILLTPAPSIHTAFMRFPIDIVFADRWLRVVKVAAEVGPWRTATSRHARYALELSAGEAARRGIEVGDQLAIGAPNPSAAAGSIPRPDGPKEPLLIDAPRARRSAPFARLASAEGHGRSSGDSLGLGLIDRHTPPRAPSSGISVLLVGTDRRFRSVAATLLERRGLIVSELEEIAARGREALADADVVVVDTGNSLTRAAHDARTIAALSSGVGIVLVAERPLDGLSSMPVLSKWGSFDALVSAIQGAYASRPEPRGEPPADGIR